MAGAVGGEGVGVGVAVGICLLGHAAFREDGFLHLTVRIDELGCVFVIAPFHLGDGGSGGLIGFLGDESDDGVAVELVADVFHRIAVAGIVGGEEAGHVVVMDLGVRIIRGGVVPVVRTDEARPLEEAAGVRHDIVAVLDFAPVAALDVGDDPVRHGFVVLADEGDVGVVVDGGFDLKADLGNFLFISRPEIEADVSALEVEVAVEGGDVAIEGFLGPGGDAFERSGAVGCAAGDFHVVFIVKLELGDEELGALAVGVSLVVGEEAVFLARGDGDLVPLVRLGGVDETGVEDIADLAGGAHVVVVELDPAAGRIGDLADEVVVDVIVGNGGDVADVVGDGLDAVERAAGDIEAALE